MPNLMILKDGRFFYPKVQAHGYNSRNQVWIGSIILYSLVSGNFDMKWEASMIDTLIIDIL